MVNLTSFIKDMGQITQALGAIQETSRSFSDTINSVNDTVQSTKSVFSSDSYVPGNDYSASPAFDEAATFEAPSLEEPAIEAQAESKVSALSMASNSPVASVANSTAAPAYNYPSNGYTAGSDWRISLDDIKFSKVTSLVSHAAGGGAAAYHFSAAVATNVRDVFNATAPQSQSSVGQGLKGLGLNIAKGAGVSALVSMGVSAIETSAGVATGKITGEQAVRHIAKDTVGGAVGGLGALAAGGLGQLLLGATGTFGLVASVAMGTIGGVVGGRIGNRMMISAWGE